MGDDDVDVFVKWWFDLLDVCCGGDGGFCFGWVVVGECGDLVCWFGCGGLGCWGVFGVVGCICWLFVVEWLYGNWFGVV